MNEEILSDVKKILKDHEQRIKRLEEGGHEGQIRPQTPHDSSSDSSLQQISKRISVPVEQIKNIYDLHEDSLTVLRFPPGNTKEQTQTISLLALIGHLNFKGMEEVPTGELRRNVAENRIPLDNFSTYLNEMIPRLIQRKGKARSNTTTYRLTHSGKAEAIALIQRMCNSEQA